MEAARRAGFRSAQAQPEPSPARIQPKASPKPARRSIGFRQTAIRSGLRNEPGLALPGLWRICRKAAFSEPVQRRAVNCFLPPSAPGNSVYFAPCLIAAKPVKPCDRGVFGALNLLLILKRANGKAGGGSDQPNPTQPKPKSKLVFAGLPIRWVRVTNRACLARLAAHLPQSRVFRGLLRVESQTVFAAVRFLKRAVMSL